MLTKEVNVNAFIRPLVVACFLVASTLPALAVTEIRQETIAIPNYNDFACGRTSNKARGTAIRVCRSLYDNSTLDPEADNMFIEYLLVESEEPSLLIWSRVTRNADAVEMRFYRRESGSWIFLDDRVWLRKEALPGQDIPLFTLDSEFGCEYQKMQCQFYEPDCKVFIPTFRFP